MSRYIIEIVDGNEFNEGWLAYVLGLPRDPNRSAIWADGWDTGRETSSLEPVRYVFETQRDLDRPQYRIETDQ